MVSSATDPYASSSSIPSSQGQDLTAIPPTRGVFLIPGLEGQDDNYDLLCGMFEQLQVATVEAANPELDLITFASGAHYLGVIVEREISEQEKDQEKMDKRKKTVEGWEMEDRVSMGIGEGGMKTKAVYEIEGAPYAVSKTGKSRVADYEFEQPEYSTLDKSLLDIQAEILAEAQRKVQRYKQMKLEIQAQTGQSQTQNLNTARSPSPTPSIDSISSSATDDDVSSYVTGHDFSAMGEGVELYRFSRPTRPTKGSDEILGYEPRRPPKVKVTKVKTDAATVQVKPTEDTTTRLYSSNNMLADIFTEKPVSILKKTGHSSAMPEQSIWPASYNQDQSKWSHTVVQQPVMYDTPTSMNTYANFAPYNTTTSLYGSGAPKAKPDVLAGLVYLMPSQNYTDHLHVGELSLGIILLPEHRGKGYARQAVQQVLKIAFSDQTCHRVQVVIIGGADKERNLKLFTHAGFSHEGTRERAFCHPYDHNTWKDVTYMGILATDWLIPDVRRQRFKAPQSLWDELLSRHQREREELIQWDEKRNPTANSLKRTLSTETLRGGLSVQSRSDVEGGDKDVDMSTPNESKANPFDDPYSSSSSSALYNKKRKLEGKRKGVDEREYNSSDDDDGSVWGAPSLSSLRQIRAQKETEMGLSSGMGARVRSGSVSGASESSHAHSGFSSSPPPPSDTESRHSWDMLDSASDSGDVFSASDDDDIYE